MAMITCKDCKSEISSDAKQCPKCGAPVASASNTLGALIGLSFTVFLLWFFFSGGVENKVSADAEKQYEITLKNGGPIDVCVQAGFVAAAYLQAKNESKYQEWKKIESRDCRNAGVQN